MICKKKLIIIQDWFIIKVIINCRPALLTTKIGFKENHSTVKLNLF